MCFSRLQSLENCIGCMVNVSNVKLTRRCDSSQPDGPAEPNACVNCYCRPMWCADCLGKW